MLTIFSCAPRIFVSGDKLKWNQKGAVSTRFKVDSIGYNENEEINYLVIVDSKSGDTLYTFGTRPVARPTAPVAKKPAPVVSEKEPSLDSERAEDPDVPDADGFMRIPDDDDVPFEACAPSLVANVEVKKITASQAKGIKTTLKKYGMPDNEFCDLYSIHSIEDMPKDAYDDFKQTGKAMLEKYAEDHQ